MTRTTNETVLVCRPRLLSDGRDNDSTSETGSSETDSDSPFLGDSDSDHNAELPPLTPPWFVAELPKLFPGDGEIPGVADTSAPRIEDRPVKSAPRLVPEMLPGDGEIPDTCPAGDRLISGRAAGPASTFPGGAVDDLIVRRRRTPTEISSPSSPATRSSKHSNHEHRRHHLHGDGHPR